MRLIDEVFNTPNLEHKTLREDYALISELLPYRHYDDENRLFHNKSSVAFLMEVSPLLGADDNVVNILTNMICDGLPEGATIQFMNIARMNISQHLSAWKQPREKIGGIYKNLAEKRE